MIPTARVHDRVLYLGSYGSGCFRVSDVREG